MFVESLVKLTSLIFSVIKTEGFGKEKFQKMTNVLYVQMEPEAMLSSPSLSVADGESKKDNKPQEPADCGKEECSQAGSCKCAEIHHTSRPIEWKSDDQSVTSLIRHSLGESSFSAVGPVSGRISYSGPVPYSGSISLRSDSSTTSTRSFAFPMYSARKLVELTLLHWPFW